MIKKKAYHSELSALKNIIRYLKSWQKKVPFRRLFMIESDVYIKKNNNKVIVRLYLRDKFIRTEMKIQKIII